MKKIITLLLLFTAITSYSQDVKLNLLLGGNAVKTDSVFQSSWNNGIGVSISDGNEEIRWVVDVQTSYMLFYPGMGLDTYKAIQYQSNIGLATPNEFLKFQVSAGYLNNLNTERGDNAMIFGFTSGVNVSINDNMSVGAQGSLMNTSGALTPSTGKRTLLLTGHIMLCYKIK